jgi:hypothetical protein
VFIWSEILNAKAKELIFVYVIMQIINKNTSLRLDRRRRKSIGGLSSTREEKGRGL